MIDEKSIEKLFEIVFFPNEAQIEFYHQGLKVLHRYLLTVEAHRLIEGRSPSFEESRD